MITPEIRHLRAFIAVAEELHFGRGAARLNIVQPALSMQIRALEEILGVQLLRRTRRMVALTEPGRLFLDEARRILRQLESAVDLIQRAGRGEAGRLVIGYSAATAHSGLLSRVIGAFHRSAPAVKLDIRELHPALQREALLAGDLDVGFVVSDAASRSPEFDSHVVEMWEMMLALPRDHLLAGQAVVPLASLGEEPYVSYEAMGEDLGVDAFREAAGFPPLIAHRAANPVMMLSLVGAGLGMAVVPAAMRNGAPSDVAFAAADPPFATLPVVALFRRDNLNAAVVRLRELI